MNAAAVAIPVSAGLVRPKFSAQPLPQIKSEIVDPFASARWDELIETHPQATIFHSSAWLRVLETTYKHQPFCLRFFDGGETLALVPLMEVKSAITGRRGVSLPFADIAPALIFAPHAASAIENEIQNLARERKWKSFELRGESALFRNVSATTEFFEHQLDLRFSADELFARFDSSARRAVRKAEACRLTVTVSQTPDALAKFYRLHSRTRKRLGSPPQPFAFFRNIGTEIFRRDLGFVVLAERSSRPLAGAVFFQFGKRALFKFGASDEAAQNLRGNNLAMWRGIQELACRGAESLHFGRTSLANNGLRRFKLSWGAEEASLKYFRLDPGTGRALAAPDRAAGWHNQIFRRMPLALNKLAGTLMYPHLD